tara:strand:- start:219 stop:923 length:705 start_codon:yes stop_codon:yes gene_type:complete
MNLLIIFFFSLSLAFSSASMKIGEKLKYRAYFGGVPAAEASLEIIGKEKLNGTSTYHVRFSARSKGIINYLFPINDKIDLWLTEDSLLTVKESLRIREGNYKKSQEMILNHNKNFVVLNSDTLTIPGNTHSPYALFYFFRRKDFNQVELDTLNTTNGKKTTALKVEIERDVKVNVPAGSFTCTKISPMKLDEKEFKNRSQMSILFSNDEKRYPVKIWLTMKYGSLVLELNKITN